jgi:cation diffusion facilitator CzcD-associated flavoprotein CzcO
MARTARRILIVGSGFGGLGLAIRLKRAGIDSFTILEKATSLGGTWRDNTYPGAACDAASMLYCYSFEQKTDWSRKWSPQCEILAYMEHCARRNGIYPHIRFNCEVARARFDAAAGTWTVTTTTGVEIAADVLVSGVGQLHRPSVPNIRGLEDFRGVAFHSARWNHDYRLSGKRVGVIGNAASAIQFIPEIARDVKQLSIFIRSANWMIPRHDRAYRPWEKWAFTHVPGVARAYRWLLWCLAELMLYPVMRRRPALSRLYERWSRKNVRDHVGDPALRKILIPDYPIGAKRILIHDDFYPALNRPNVEVVAERIERITPDGVRTADGKTRELDAIILATGFETNPFLAPMHVEGLGGRRLEDDWADGARAYYGLTVSGYPNFFMLYGPNTNLGHNSIIFMMECQMTYILNAIRALEAGDLAYLDLRREALDQHNEELQAELRRTVWAAAGQSWYKDAAGRITNNWPYSTFWYWWCTRRIDLAKYRLITRAAAAAQAAKTERVAA